MYFDFLIQGTVIRKLTKSKCANGDGPLLEAGSIIYADKWKVSINIIWFNILHLLLLTLSSSIYLNLVDFTSNDQSKQKTNLCQNVQTQLAT